MSTRALPVLALAVLALAASPACSSADGSEDDASGASTVDTSRAAVIKGKASDASQNAVVLLMHIDMKKGAFGECTGTMIAPNLVLTARHCVADTDEAAACKSDGTPIAEGAVRKNHDPESLYVFTGTERPVFHSRADFKPEGQGAKIIDDGGKNLCNHDFALVLLKAPIEGAEIAPLRLDSDVEKGETLTSVGWGLTERGSMPDERQQRTGVKVLDVGPAKPSVPSNEFQVGESICSGDSGGPAFAPETGAVVGVVSRGGNGMGGQDSANPAANCIQGENLYTKVSPFKDLVLEAFALAEADPWVEGGPDPRLAKPNAACTDASECRSNMCFSDNRAGGKTCAQDCSDGTACPSGESCVTVSGSKVCRAPKADDGGFLGCSTANATSSLGGSSSGSANGWLALGALAFIAARRRRR